MSLTAWKEETSLAFVLRAATEGRSNRLPGQKAAEGTTPSNTRGEEINVGITPFTMPTIISVFSSWESCKPECTVQTIYGLQQEILAPESRTAKWEGLDKTETFRS